MRRIKELWLDFKVKYKKNPAWYWLLLSLFTFFLLPEYVSPFILFAAFIIFKRQWTREGRLAKVGNLGKIEMALMGLMLLSTLWSPTKLDTLGSAGLWWAVILIQVMIFNLARTKEKVKKVITAVVASAALNGLVGTAQILTFILSVNHIISPRLVLVTPFYRYLDVLVYKALPFSISTSMWAQRASGFFSNPNLLATFMIVAFPLAGYLFLNASSRASKIRYFLAITCITAGMASTMSRAGCYVILASWVVLFVVYIKHHRAETLAVFIPTAGTTIPSLLIRYGKISIYPADLDMAEIMNYIPYIPELIPIDGMEAIQSSQVHFDIWKSLADYLIHHVPAFLFGTGFGCEQTGHILYEQYQLNKPHAHNVIIEFWAELGIVGVILLAVIIVYAIGKLLEIKQHDFKALTIVVAVMTSLISLMIFGLSDFIFNSPKQIIQLMILLGLTQALSYNYEKRLIHTATDLSKVARDDWDSLVNQ